MNKSKYYWIPIKLWNLNEVFTTESLSPISFYKEREFGNPISINSDKIEDENNLILFSGQVKSDVLIKVSSSLLHKSSLKEINGNCKTGVKSFEYSKTIYLKKDLIQVCFCSQGVLDGFLNNTLMLLEVKTVNKYKSNFIVQEGINRIQQKTVYQAMLYSERDEIQPFFDKAVNQIKGLVYGYVIGLIGVVDETEQSLISSLTKLKNLITSTHTDIVLSESYTDRWVVSIRKIINDCADAYFSNFRQKTDVFEMLILRLKEIDKLNKMRCDELIKQKGLDFKHNYNNKSKRLELLKNDLIGFECDCNVIHLREELNQIKKEEKARGEAKGKSREYYKKGSVEFTRKQELKDRINKFNNNVQYSELRDKIKRLENDLREYQFGFTNFDSSISEQFSRIEEYLHGIIKQTLNHFLMIKKKDNKYPEILFKVDVEKLTQSYQRNKIGYVSFSIGFPKSSFSFLKESELDLVNIILNSILCHPQGRLGNYSEKTVLDILISIGKELPDDVVAKQTLRDYYKFRKGESVDYMFPDNNVLASLLIFIMKLNGPDQITKMLIKRNIHHKELALMFYGAFVGFANMPKTFTNVIFDSGNQKLFDLIDEFLFDEIINFRK